MISSPPSVHFLGSVEAVASVIQAGTKCSPVYSFVFSLAAFVTGALGLSTFVLLLIQKEINKIPSVGERAGQRNATADTEPSMLRELLAGTRSPTGRLAPPVADSIEAPMAAMVDMMIARNELVAKDLAELHGGPAEAPEPPPRPRPAPLVPMPAKIMAPA